MGRKVASPPVALQGADAAPVGVPARLRWPLGLKATALAVAVVALVGIVAFVLGRDVAAPARARTATPAAVPARPAFTADEERYIRALWPIHGEVRAQHDAHEPRPDLLHDQGPRMRPS